MKRGHSNAFLNSWYADWFRNGLYLIVMILMRSSVCSNLRCIDCDFIVIQFQDRYWYILYSVLYVRGCWKARRSRVWNKSADYMFFREHMPNEYKLQAKLDEYFGALQLFLLIVSFTCGCRLYSVRVPMQVDFCRIGTGINWQGRNNGTLDVCGSFRLRICSYFIKSIVINAVVLRVLQPFFLPKLPVRRDAGCLSWPASLVVDL